MAAMLPWRRSKFVLVEDSKGKGKSLAPALSYAALLSNFIRSCPDLWADCPLERLGSLFRHRRQKVELNKEDPTYTVWYLGNAVTLQAKGEGCTHEAVEKIWGKSEFGGRSTKMKLTLGPHGIHMSPCEKGARRPSHAYLLHRITYCVADRRHPKVFAWVYRHQVKNKAVVLRCHAVLLSKPEKAQSMAVLLCQTTHSAFNEFKRLKRQNDSRHVQQQLLGEAIVPVAPLRKLLNCKCPYRPPADRNRSAPRLSAIQEEEEEEERGGREGRRISAPGNGYASGSPRHADGIHAAVILCTGGHQSLAHTAAGSVVVQCLRLPNRVATEASPGGAAEHPPPRVNTAAAAPVSKMASGPERPELLTLAHEMRFCTLRGPVPPVDTPPWDAPEGDSCSPC